jgi:uncharacterized protein DUF6515
MKALSSGAPRALAAFALLAIVTGPSVAFATRPGEHEWHDSHHGRHEWHDVRYHHDHYYPARGVYIDVLPPRAVITVHGGVRFYFSGGVWYRPEGARFVVVAPPFGVVVPALPPYYTTVYVRGAPYYYANDVYYVPAGRAIWSSIHRLPALWSSSRRLRHPRPRRRRAPAPIRCSYTLVRIRVRSSRHRIATRAISGP